MQQDCHELFLNLLSNLGDTTTAVNALRQQSLAHAQLRSSRMMCDALRALDSCARDMDVAAMPTAAEAEAAVAADTKVVVAGVSQEDAMTGATRLCAVAQEPIVVESLDAVAVKNENVMDAKAVGSVQQLSSIGECKTEGISSSKTSDSSAYEQPDTETQGGDTTEHITITSETFANDL